MINCHTQINKFHNEKVTLSEQNRAMMRKKRESNRNKIRDGLKGHQKFWPQGSYAMHTMVQAKHNDFDIDDGLYIDMEDFKNDDGSLMKPKEIREKIENIIKSKEATAKTKVKTSCVRVQYEAGYHVDIPAYRVINEGGGERYELAFGDEWKESNPKGVTDWFKKAVSNKSPEKFGSLQMRRIVRLLKFFSKRQQDWISDAPSGLIISVLVDECYVGEYNRDDLALYETMSEIYDRLKNRLNVYHPIFKDEDLTKGTSDYKMQSFLKKLGEALEILQILDKCTLEEEALKAWGKVFGDVNYFCPPTDGGTDNGNSNEGMKRDGRDPVKKKGGGRYA